MPSGIEVANTLATVDYWSITAVKTSESDRISNALLAGESRIYVGSAGAKNGRD